MNAIFRRPSMRPIRSFDLASCLAPLAIVALESVADGTAVARSGSAVERPYAPYHIANLPDEVQRHVRSRAKECGNAPEALHNFTVSIEGEGREFISIHYDKLRCDVRPSVCRPSGCLHEILVRKGSNWTVVFQALADETQLSNAGGRICLSVRHGARSSTFAWMRDRFRTSPECRGSW